MSFQNGELDTSEHFPPLLQGGVTWRDQGPSLGSRIGGFLRGVGNAVRDVMPAVLQSLTETAPFFYPNAGEPATTQRVRQRVNSVAVDFSETDDLPIRTLNPTDSRLQRVAQRVLDRIGQLHEEHIQNLLELNKRETTHSPLAQALAATYDFPARPAQSEPLQVRSISQPARDSGLAALSETLKSGGNPIIPELIRMDRLSLCP